MRIEDEDLIGEAWATYIEYRKLVPQKQIEAGCITFSAFIDAKTASESVNRCRQLIGPHGRAIFLAWVCRQTS